MRIKLLIVSVCCLFPFLEIDGQNKKFESKKLQQAASLLSKEVPYAEALYQFTENYLNQLLSVSTQEREWKMKADDVRLEDGAFDRLHLVNDGTRLAMRAKDNRYTISLSNDNFKLIELSCSMSYQLIVQQSLKKLEEGFMKELSEYKAKKKAIVEVRKEDLTRTAPRLYVKKGADYFLEAINSNLYYVEDKEGKLNLAYDPGYLAESVSNMLISEDISCDIMLKLSIRQYGFKTDELLLPLKQWIGYCRSKGCDMYIGIEAMETDRLKASVFAVNETFKYNHVMNVTIPYALLSQKSGEIDGTITIFIPTHNLFSLFEEMNLINKKTKNR